jgi:hypothetical protein
LKDIVEAFEEGGARFMMPEEGKNGEGVMLTWGVESALRQGNDDEENANPKSNHVSRALPSDPDLLGLYEYWHNRQAEWRTLSQALRNTILQEIFGEAPCTDLITDGTVK